MSDDRPGAMLAAPPDTDGEPVATYLDRILDAHREAAAADRRPRGKVEEAAERAMADGPTRGFRAAPPSA